jgi:hypothetical protein
VVAKGEEASDMYEMTVADHRLQNGMKNATEPTKITKGVDLAGVDTKSDDDDASSQGGEAAADPNLSEAVTKAIAKGRARAKTQHKKIKELEARLAAHESGKEDESETDAESSDSNQTIASPKKGGSGKPQKNKKEGPGTGTTPPQKKLTGQMKKTDTLVKKLDELITKFGDESLYKHMKDVSILLLASAVCFHTLVRFLHMSMRPF